MIRRSMTWLGIVALGSLALMAGPAAARSQKRGASHDKPAPATDKDKPGDGDGAKADAPRPPGPNDITAQSGPKTIDMGNNLTLQLPEGYDFLDKVNAGKLMERMGNKPDDDTVGIITQQEATWWILVSYEGAGYVKDDDAEKMDNDEILNAIKEGTEEANKYRQERGFGAVHVDGWTESPKYDRKVHHLVWAIKGTSSKGSSINFNTRVLGRYGYASLNLIDSPENIDGSKPQVQKMLAATTFNQGARYEDVDLKKDKIAEYGLAALVAGGAGAAALKLVKVGLLAKFGGKLLALIIAGKKALVLVVVGIGAALKKLLGIKKKATDAPPAAGPPGASPPQP